MSPARKTAVLALLWLVTGCGARTGALASGTPGRMVTVAELVANAVPAGDSVRVRGTCIGYSRVLALGPQPRTRSDWQLLDGDSAIWVVGPYPRGCSGSAPAAEPDTFAVTVALDTLPALGAQILRPRSYLVYRP